MIIDDEGLSCEENDICCDCFYFGDCPLCKALLDEKVIPVKANVEVPICHYIKAGKKQHDEEILELDKKPDLRIIKG